MLRCLADVNHLSSHHYLWRKVHVVQVVGHSVLLWPTVEVQLLEKVVSIICTCPKIFVSPTQFYGFN